MSVELKGLEELVVKLGKVASEEKMKAALGNACALVQREAKTKAPKGSGELRRSITSKVTDDGGELAGVVFTTLFYAPYVEYGTGLYAEEGGRQDVPWCYKDDAGEWHTTSGMHPHPYMRPALAENREKIKRILKEGATKSD